MLASLRSSSLLARTGAAAFSTASNLPKATVVGASGGIGQPLSLLLKLSPYVGDLSLYDIVGTPGVAADLGHINKLGEVKGYVGNEQLLHSLQGSKVVVIPAGVPRKPGMTRDDLFNTNASIVQGIAEACAKACPEALFLIISNPVNSTVPIFAETLKKASVYDKNKVIGVTTLDVVRARTFCGEALNRNPEEMDVTVIGGHAGKTILPLLSSIPNQNFTEQQIAELTHRIQFGGDEVVKAKDGTGSATLSMAYAAAIFIEDVTRAMSGEKGVTACAYVESPVAVKDGAEFFASPCVFGPNGVAEIPQLPKMSAFEEEGYKSMIGDLAAQIEKGKAFANSS